MSDATPDHGRTVLWCLRHYAWLVLACVLVGAGVPLIIGSQTQQYQADALVVARQLSVNPSVLPDLAQNVFSDGAVAAKVATDPSVHGVTTGLIPDRVSVVAGQDSIALDVQAQDPDPATAARLANLAAAAFVAELNRAGSGIGVFAVQSQASPPVVPVSTLAPTLLAAIGGGVGVVVGLGLVALFGSLRRPIVAAWQVEAALGVPLLGTVRLPVGRRGTYRGPLGVRGIATVARSLAGVAPGRLLLISAPSAAALRHRVYVMAAVALWSVRRVRIAAPDEIVQAVRAHCLALAAAGRTPPGDDGPTEDLVLVDGGSPLEILDPTTTRLSVVVVAPRGVARRRLRALAADYEDAGLAGVVLATAHLSLRGPKVLPLPAPTPAPAETKPVARDLPVPVPERA